MKRGKGYTDKSTLYLSGQRHNGDREDPSIDSPIDITSIESVGFEDRIQPKAVKRESDLRIPPFDVIWITLSTGTREMDQKFLKFCKTYIISNRTYFPTANIRRDIHQTCNYLWSITITVSPSRDRSREV